MTASDPLWREALAAAEDLQRLAAGLPVASAARAYLVLHTLAEGEDAAGCAESAAFLRETMRLLGGDPPTEGNA